MEQERESEEWADAFNCCLVARKTAMPANNIPRRHPHSKNWIEAKQKSFKDFQDLLIEITQSKRKRGF